MNLKKIVKINPIYFFLKTIYHSFKDPIFSFFISIYQQKPIDPNKIVIDNFSGRGFGDNPKYIAQSLLKNSPKLDIVWLVDDINIKMPNKIRKVKIGSLKAMYELCTAKVWIDNIKSNVKPSKREGQFYLQTWHGGIALKAVEAQVEKNLNPSYVKVAKRDANQTDLMLSDSDWTTNLFRNYFWYRGKIVKSGFPRNDVLVRENSEIIKKVYDFFDIDINKKIILYAPTFRDGETDTRVYNFNFKQIITALNKKFKEEYELLIRLHPNIEKLGFAEKMGNIHYLNATHYPDMQELLVATDVLITDFSSSMFDSMLTNKKVFLLAKDYERYTSKNRKLLFNIKQDLPFSFANDERELLKEIADFEEKEYINRIDKFKDELKIKEDGYASDRVAEFLTEKVMTN